MDVMVVASDALKALSIEATLDLGGHRVVSLAVGADALDHARASRPSLAIVQLEGLACAELVRELRDDLSVPSLLVGADAACSEPHRAAAMGLIREPCGSRTILRAVKVAAGLREGRRPRGRLPRQIEIF
jgi:DNA-binding response OmpR family regulator